MNNIFSETLPAITWAVIIGVTLYTLIFGRQRKEKEKEVVDDTTKVSRRSYVEEKDRNINERNREREEKEEEDQLGDDQFIDD
jgi:diphthamide biosynthesis methyltransferase